MLPQRGGGGNSEQRVGVGASGVLVRVDRENAAGAACHTNLHSKLHEPWPGSASVSLAGLALALALQRDDAASQEQDAEG